MRALFAVATPLERLLGPTGTMVLTRLPDIAALSVQFVPNGAQAAGII